MKCKEVHDLENRGNFCWGESGVRWRRNQNASETRPADTCCDDQSSMKAISGGEVGVAGGGGGCITVAAGEVGGT